MKPIFNICIPSKAFSVAAWQSKCYKSVWQEQDSTSVCSRTMVNGVSLESIKLKKPVFDGHIADKVEGFHGPHRTDPILFLRQVPGLRSP